MKIVHFAPFAPCGCGLYEAAKDMASADFLAGHDVDIVDVGSTYQGGNHTPGEPGKLDQRGFVSFTSADPIVTRNADLLIAHSGVPDPWFSITQAPMIWVLHGRPTACFGPEQFGKGSSYSLIHDIARWPRVKALVSFWQEHEPFWNNILPEEKLFFLQAPPVDLSRFGPSGIVHDFGALGGVTNVVIADSVREDIGLFEVANGALEYARNYQGVKFHFYGMENPLQRCWDLLLTRLKEFGALGEIWARRPNMEEVFRAADIVLSPHVIATRVVAEALCCGTPVIANLGNRFATWQCDINNPMAVAECIKRAKDDKGFAIEKTVFSLESYNKSMEQVYAHIRI